MFNKQQFFICYSDYILLRLVNTVGDLIRETTIIEKLSIVRWMQNIYQYAKRMLF